MGLGIARRRRIGDRAREHSLRQVEDALELGIAPCRGDVPRPEQPFAGRLDRGPVPAPVLAIPVFLHLLQLAGGDRPGPGDIGADPVDEVRVFGSDTAHAAPGLFLGARRTKPQSRLEGDIDQAGRMPPILEEPPR